MSQAAVEVINCFLGKIIVEPAAGLALTAETLTDQFREFISDTSKSAADAEVEQTSHWQMVCVLVLPFTVPDSLLLF